MSYKKGDRVIITTRFDLFSIETNAVIIRVKEHKNVSLNQAPGKSYRVRYKLGYKFKNTSTHDEKDFKPDKQYYRNIKLNNLLNEV
jgi:hypothetical protein